MVIIKTNPKGRKTLTAVYDTDDIASDRMCVLPNRPLARLSRVNKLTPSAFSAAPHCVRGTIGTFLRPAVIAGCTCDVRIRNVKNAVLTRGLKRAKRAKKINYGVISCPLF